MHAWSTISHYLDYKSPNAIPSHLRKDFNALSALFYVADSHFELFFRSSQEAKKDAEEKAQDFTKIEEEEINLDTLIAYLHNKYTEREHADASKVSELVEILVAAGYTKISHLDSDLKKSERAIKEYEKESVTHLLDIGIVRISILLANEKIKSGKLLRERFKKYLG